MFSNRVYLMQYTGLMMIILLMILALYAQQQPVQKVSADTLNNQIRLEKTSERSLIHFSDLFHARKANLNIDRAQALAALLAQHDISARIEVRASRMDGDLMALQRSRQLIKYLQQKNIPLDLVRVYAASYPSAKGRQVEIFFE